MSRILIVEDDHEINKLLADFLQKNGYETASAEEGGKASLLLRKQDFDIVLMDLMLPYKSGEHLIKEFREYSQIPVIVLSAKSMMETRLEVLRLGADDYMIKPFDSKELVARVKAVLRRFQPAKEDTLPGGAGSMAPNAQNGDYVEYPGLLVNLTNYAVTYLGHTVEMPPKELELLYFLASHPNQVFTREQLLDHIWGYEYIGDTRTVDVHVKRLREKIKDRENWSIATVWGIGYKFEVKSR